MAIDIAKAPSETLLKPLRWKKPRRVFVNSMSDLFHEDVPYEWVDVIFAVMALTPQHIYQVLTKRSDRMLEYLTRERETFVNEHAAAMMHYDEMPQRNPGPLSNVILGVSAEDQERADLRIPDLMRAPAAMRFVSCEPLLGPINLKRWTTDVVSYDAYCDAVGGPQPDLRMIDWVIVGAESGPKSRPMEDSWARSIKQTCEDAGVAFFLKQRCSKGKKIPIEQWPEDLQVQESPYYYRATKGA